MIDQKEKKNISILNKHKEQITLSPAAYTCNHLPEKRNVIALIFVSNKLIPIYHVKTCMFILSTPSSGSKYNSKNDNSSFTNVQHL